MNSTEIIRNYIDNQLHYPRVNRAGDIDEVTLPSTETIIISYADISITGTERARPQIRIFTDNATNGYHIARSEKKRFFFLTIYSKAAAYVSYLGHITPSEYIVSLETNVSSISGRMDIRSMYEWLDGKVAASSAPINCIRCNNGDHACGIYQASFLRISNGGTAIIPAEVTDYLNIFDMRPYFIPSLVTFNYTPLDERDKRNVIAFGAPGTGKSYFFKKYLDEHHVSSDDYERVTFYSDYSYSQFIGTYKPVDVGGMITYKFVPGPFMRTLVAALEDASTTAPHKHYLIIEELNRAKAAAVFGDMFQLLDRDDTGRSEYSINASEDIRAYLAEHFGGAASAYSKLAIPNNMYIFATMNSADQGVFPMDTAFKRRWNFNYIGIDDEEFKVNIDPSTGVKTATECQSGTFNLADGAVEWNVLRRAINAKLSNDRIKAHEDKLMGPFFMKTQDSTGTCLFTLGHEDEEFSTLFCEKVIMYLFEDAAKTKHKELFEGCDSDKLNRFSYICAEFKSRGLAIIGSDFRSREYANQIAERDAAKMEKEC